MRTIKVDDSTPRGKSLIAFLKANFDDGTVVLKEENTVCKDLKQALKEAKTGKIEPIQNLFK